MMIVSIALIAGIRTITTPKELVTPILFTKDRVYWKGKPIIKLMFPQIIHIMTLPFNKIFIGIMFGG